MIWALLLGMDDDLREDVFQLADDSGVDLAGMLLGLE